MLSPEWWTVVLTAGSLIVIAISAVAALRQIEHLRLGNQSATLLVIARRFQDPDVSESSRYARELDTIVDRLGASPTVDDMRSAGAPAIALFHFYEMVGVCVTYRMLDAAVVVDLLPLHASWRHSERYIREFRRVTGTPELYEHFEAQLARINNVKPTALPKMPDSSQSG